MAGALKIDVLVSNFCGWLGAIRSYFSMSLPPSDVAPPAYSEEIADEEIFYRRIPDSSEYLQTDEDGRILLDENRKPKLSSQAFGDRLKKVSVDRAKLLNHRPEYAKENSDDFIVSLQAQKIRSIRDIPARELGKQRVIDIRPDPIGTHCIVKTHEQKPENPAHCFISADPVFEKRDDKHFKKLKEALKRISTWEIEPPLDHHPS